MNDKKKEAPKQVFEVDSVSGKELMKVGTICTKLTVMAQEIFHLSDRLTQRVHDTVPLSPEDKQFIRYAYLQDVRAIQKDVVSMFVLGDTDATKEAQTALTRLLEDLARL